MIISIDQRLMAPTTLIVGSIARHLSPQVSFSPQNQPTPGLHGVGCHPRNGECMDLNDVEEQERYGIISNLASAVAPSAASKW